MGLSTGGASAPPPTYFIVLDPGDTTGWATFKQQEDGGWALVATGEFGGDNDITPFLKGTAAVVVEETPMGRGTPRQREVILRAYAIAEADGIKAIHVYPGSWKPWAKARITEFPRRLEGQRHARDAYCMGRYVIAMGMIE